VVIPFPPRRFGTVEETAREPMYLIANIFDEKNSGNIPRKCGFYRASGTVDSGIFRRFSAVFLPRRKYARPAKNLFAFAPACACFRLCRRYACSAKTNEFAFAPAYSYFWVSKQNVMIYRFPRLTSTNDEAQNPKYRHADLILADEQTAGRGQRGHTWHSAPGENLLCTLVLEPCFLRAADQFSLLEAVALGLADALASLGVAPRIKWTNDLYVRDRKIVGVLIEHALCGSLLRRTSVGIGVNVNQIIFDSSLPNPTSLRLEAGRTFVLDEVAAVLHAAVTARYDRLAAGDAAELHEEYVSMLWHINKVQRFRSPDGREYEATIRGVAPAGDLLLEHPDGTQTAQPFRSLEFVL